MEMLDLENYFGVITKLSRTKSKQSVAARLSIVNWTDVIYEVNVIHRCIGQTILSQNIFSSMSIFNELMYLISRLLEV